MKKWMMVVCPFVFLINAFAQSQFPRTGQNFTLKGKVIDASTKAPLEYATVIVFTLPENQQLTGTVTEKDGTFTLENLPAGKFRIQVKFIGYKTYEMEPLSLDQTNPSRNLGVIALQPTVLPGQGVEIQANRPEFEYKIDRKVINVGQQQTAISGTAVDVLTNVPSVTVDVEGNVQLRGSSNFTVLIDNRPTPLEPNEALQQTPASAIDKIEIITNPSAKYDPDGTAGIINLILKKSQQGGVTGTFNTNLGLDDLTNRSGGDFLVNYRFSQVTLYVGADFNARSFPGTLRANQRTSLGDTAFYRFSTGDQKRGGEGYGIRGGLDYSINEKNLLSIGFRVGGRSFEGNFNNHYQEWNSLGVGYNTYWSQDQMGRDGNFYSTNLDFRHTFSRPDHELLFQLIIGHNNGDEHNKNVLFNESDSLTEGQRATESGPFNDLRLKMDYTLPLGASKIQAGYQNRLGIGSEKTERFFYDIPSAVYVYQAPFSHEIRYVHNIHSLYGTFSSQYRNIGYQLGVRGEYTGREIELRDIAQKFTIDRWDIFPTLHLSYTLAKGKQAMASYTRRIERPREWELEPFETWMDAYNVRKGNPDLKPEFIDSYEATFQSTVGKSLFSVEMYYRVTHNKIERTQSLYAPRITLHSIDNIGQDYAFGSEIMWNFDVFRFWNINVMSNVYQYWIKGELFGESFSRESFNWSLRFNHTLQLGKNTRLQINSIYNSPSVSSQGKQEENFFVNLGLRKEFLNKMLSATFQIQDVFKTQKFEFTNQAPNFYSATKMKRKAPLFTLTLTYHLNNNKQKEESRLEETGERQESEEEMF